MHRVSRHDWVKRIERWADSGLTAKEFASEIGCNHYTLQHWKYRLARQQRADVSAEARQPSPKPRSKLSGSRASIEFVELAAPPASATSSRLELQLRGGAVRLLVPLDADPAAVARLVDALAVAA